MVNKDIIEKAKEYVLNIPEDLGIKNAFLFGSFAKGTEREDSDIDIAVVLENMSDFFVTQRQLMSLRILIDLRIEPHPFSTRDFNSQNPFACEIEKTGIEII